MPIELLPDLSLTCIELPISIDGLCVQFPGGATFCAVDNLEIGDPLSIVRAFLANLNTALVPLTPFFNVLDVLKCIFDCVQAIPDSILTLNPQPIVECLVNLGKAIDKLLAMLPPLAVPVLVKGILDVLIAGLRGIRTQMEVLIRQANRIVAAATRAAELGNLQLQFVADCAQGNLDATLANLNASMAPLNRIIGLMNALLEMANLPCIPALGSFTEVSEAMLAPIDAAIAMLEGIKLAIPSLSINIPGLPPAGECP